MQNDNDSLSQINGWTMWLIRFVFVSVAQKHPKNTGSGYRIWYNRRIMNIANDRDEESWKRITKHDTELAAIY